MSFRHGSWSSACAARDPTTATAAPAAANRRRLKRVPLPPIAGANSTTGAVTLAWLLDVRYGCPRTMAPIVVVDKLVKRYKGADVNAVDGVSFSVEPGELFALLGPN